MKQLFRITTDAFGNKGAFATVAGIDGGDIEGADENGTVILHYTLKADSGTVMEQVYRDEFELAEGGQ